MIDTKEFGQALKKRGYNFYSGVPCSHLQYLINYAINDCDYIMAANEGDAVAACAGATLGGKKAVFLCQNSGLTNATSPLTSLNYTFKLPVLGFVSLRGEPGIADEPQHELMGQITTPMLDLMQIPWEFLSTELNAALEQIARADAFITKNQSFFFVVKKDTFAKEALKNQSQHRTQNEVVSVKNGTDTMPARLQVLERLMALKDTDTLYLATTGKTGRELSEACDAANNLYMVGSMGCVSSLGLGLALAQPHKNIITIDGDGALLMRLGSLTTNAYYAPKNMFHLLLDNNTHDSTGGQFTVSHNIDFVQLAASTGYKNVFYLHNLDELEKAVAAWRTKKGLTFAYLKTAKGSKDNLGRPKVKPYQVKERFMSFINNKVEN